jgi:hypothetical protein
MCTTLRGFHGDLKRQALAELQAVFGGSEFLFRDAVAMCDIDAKIFAKLSRDGVLVKTMKRWPAHWRISSQYLSTAACTSRRHGPQSGESYDSKT